MPRPETGRAGPSRKTPVALLAVAALLLMARVATGILEEEHPPAVAVQVEWLPLEMAAEVSASKELPILYEFTASWSAPCQTMEREVFADPQSAGLINGMFVPVRVEDVSRDGVNPPEVAELIQRFGIDTFPTLVVVSADGTHERLEGYTGKSPLMQWLARAGMAGGAGTRIHIGQGGGP